METLTTSNQTALKLAIRWAQNNGKSRTINALMQKHYDENFNARGVKEKFDLTYYTFLEKKLDSYIAEMNQDIALKVLNDFDESLSQEDIDSMFDYFKSVNEEGGVNAETKQDSCEEIEEEKKDTKTKEDFEYKGSNANGKWDANFSLNLPIMEMLKHTVNENLDEILRDIDGKIKDAAKALQPNVISIGGKEAGTVSGRLHKEFTRSVALLSNLKQIFLSGPTGSGKSFLGRQLAEALNLPFGFISCTAGMSEAHLTGRMLIDGTYVDTDFVRLYENGGVFLFDEVDAADANTLLIINDAIANGQLSIANRKGNHTAKRHKDFYVICAANTWGNGSNEYSGREYLDAAFMNRFSMSKVTVDYDNDLEKQLTKDHPDIYNTFSKVRKALKGLNRPVSTRTIIDAYKLLLSGLEIKMILCQFCEDFTQEEKNKISKETGIDIK